MSSRQDDQGAIIVVIEIGGATSTDGGDGRPHTFCWYRHASRFLNSNMPGLRAAYRNGIRIDL
ncbi:MAG: hypothetical protein ACLQVD_14545 [Capsulimonadaceae bacterium]